MFRFKKIIAFFLFFIHFVAFSQSEKVAQIRELLKKSANYRLEYKFDKSLKIADSVLKLSFKINNNSLIAESYNLIGNNFNDLSEYKLGLQFHLKGLEFANKSSDFLIRKKICNNLGNNYCFDQKRYDLGLKYYKLSLAYCNKIPNLVPFDRCSTNANIAWANFELKKYKEGFPYLEYANKNYYDEDYFSVVMLNRLNATYYQNINNFKKADYYFLKGINNKNPEISENDKALLFEDYSGYLEKTGDITNAYKYIKLFNKYEKENLSEEKIQKSNLMGINIQLQETKRVLKKTELENSAKDENLKKSRIINILIFSVLITSLILLYSFYKNTKLKRKNNEELSLTNIELRKAKEAAEAVSILKSQFVSTITHELRTPLYGVIGITNMIVENKNEINDKQIESLKFSANYLLALVNDVLDYSNLDQKEIQIVNKNFDVCNKINLIKNSLSYMAKTNNVKLIVDIDENVPEKVYGDHLKLSQILINLISNAIKFSENAQVNVSVFLEKIENNKSHISFIIKDNGIGIAPENIKNIFEKFTKISHKNEKFEGSGLGLAIVKKLINLFESEIYVKSKLGVGTEISFTIPFEIAVKDEIILFEPTQTIYSKHLHVLIVDDNKINQMVTEKIIKQKHTFKSVNDGLQAIEILKSEKFDIVLMDINMPILNGYEATIQIRKLGITIPIIALTASSREHVAENVYACGMNDILIKPFDSDILFKILEKNIDNL